MPKTYDPYFVLSDVADELWDLHQKTVNSDKKTSDQAKSMYDTLENVYLEPIRRSKVRENTKKYAEISTQLNAQSDFIDKQIKRINKIVDTVEKVSEYAKIFDKILATAAKLLAAA
jgi:ABC-type transporter Mla subunit MlaD